MERNTQKIADLAGMFEDIDIEVITSVLEMCEGKVNKTAEILLKMKEDSELQEKIQNEEKKESVLNQNFLEIEEENQKKTENEAQNIELEEEYLAQIQKAIELSLDESKKGKKIEPNKKKNEKAKSLASKEKEIIKKKPEKNKIKEKEIAEIVPNPDEEIITFVFAKNLFLRGESLV